MPGRYSSAADGPLVVALSAAAPLAIVPLAIAPPSATPLSAGPLTAAPLAVPAYTAADMAAFHEFMANRATAPLVTNAPAPSEPTSPNSTIVYNIAAGATVNIHNRSRSQTPIPPESARDRRVVWKQKKRSLSLRILRLYN